MYIYMYLSIYVIYIICIQYLLIRFVHRNFEGLAWTPNLIFGMTLGPSLVVLLGCSSPSEARHARSEATRFVTANRI